MKILIITFTICLFCVSCGVKGEPEYKSKSNYNKNIYVI